jgi:hypothetical protein
MSDHIRAKIRVLLACVVGAIIFSGCNDPENAALQLFNDYGLTLLRPARSYIKPGGLVILVSKRTPAYVDPFDDDIAGLAEGKTAVEDFTATIQQSTKNQAASFDFAINLISQIVSLPKYLTSDSIGAKKSTQVTLDQIDSNGQRIKPTAVSTLIGEQKTSDLLKKQLSGGARAFVVQEVYLSKSLSLKVASATSGDISIGGSGALPQCADATGKTTGSDSSTNTTANTKDKSSGSNDSGTNATASKPPTAGAKAASPTATATKSNTQTKPNTATTSTKSDPALVTVGVCQSSAYSLTFTSTKDPIPFAVRLVEISLDKASNQLSIVYGNFKFPNSLGASETEKMTARLSSPQLSLSHLAHIN